MYSIQVNLYKLKLKRIHFIVLWFISLFLGPKHFRVSSRLHQCSVCTEHMCSYSNKVFYIDLLNPVTSISNCKFDAFTKY